MPNTKRSLREADAIKGLFLQRTKAGTRSWVYRYVFNGADKMMGLGSAEEVTQSDARAAAVAAKSLLKSGIDPIAERKDRRRKAKLASIPTNFEQLAKDYIAAHEAAWTAKQIQQWSGSLRDHVYPLIGAVHVAQIDVAKVLAVLKPIWFCKTITAKRVRWRIEAIMDRAIALEIYDRPNPASMKTVSRLLPAPGRIHEVKHYDSLPCRELPDFMAKLRERDTVRARALEFLILTGARAGDVCKATGAEFDFLEDVWTVPAVHSKTRIDLRRPLTDRAAEIVRSVLTKKGTLVFARANGKAFDDQMLRSELRAVLPGTKTVHGMRASLKTWMTETHPEWRIPVEMQLGHAVGNEVERAYQRSDLFQQRRVMMKAWERFLAEPVADANVVHLKALP